MGTHKIICCTQFWRMCTDVSENWLSRIECTQMTFNIVTLAQPPVYQVSTQLKRLAKKFVYTQHTSARTVHIHVLLRCTVSQLVCKCVSPQSQWLGSLWPCGHYIVQDCPKNRLRVDSGIEILCLITSSHHIKVIIEWCSTALNRPGVNPVVNTKTLWSWVERWG